MLMEDTGSSSTTQPNKSLMEVELDIVESEMEGVARGIRVTNRIET